MTKVPKTLAAQMNAEKAVALDMRREWLRVIIGDHVSSADVARSIGMDRSALCRLADRLGVILPNRAPAENPRSARARETYTALADEGLTVAEAAARLGVSVKSVYAASKRWGLTFRPVHGQRPKKAPPPRETVALRIPIGKKAAAVTPRAAPAPSRKVPTTLAEVAAAENARARRSWR